MRGVLDPRTLQQMQVQIVDRGYAKQTEGTLSGEAEDPSGAATLMYNSLEPNLNLVSQVAEFAGIAADRSLVVGERVLRVVFSARPGSIYEVDRLVPNMVLASGVIISLLMGLLAVIGLRSASCPAISMRLTPSSARWSTIRSPESCSPKAAASFAATGGWPNSVAPYRRSCRAVRSIPCWRGKPKRSIRCGADDDPRQRHGDRSRIAPAPKGGIGPPDRRLRQAIGGWQPQWPRRNPVGGPGQDRRDADGRRAPRTAPRTAGIECKADVIAPGCRDLRQGNRIVDRTQWRPAILSGAE